jgi:Lanthionine synthetase C-like protein
VLYRPDAFEPLTDSAWDARRAEGEIRSIVADAEVDFDPDELWQPADEWDSTGPPLTTLYAGAAGVVWGLNVLAQRGHADTTLDLPAVAVRSLERWRERPDGPERTEPPVHTHASLFWGETGPLLVAWLLAPSAELADALHVRVRENVENETNELMHGSPGTMLATQAMLRRTGDERWADVWRASADVLLARRDGDGLWMYRPYGRGLGASHGVGTNTNVLLEGGELLDAAMLDALKRETAAVLRRTAVVEDGRANWPLAAEDSGIVGFDGQIRLQWCHGGAGVVSSTSPYLDEDLLLAAVELVWEAGPPNMEKGPGICHGTAGNGYALLRVFERTQDERWLDRARRFAMHALEQASRWRAQRGRRRPSLWTGDIGAAVFAADCLDARTAVPIVDGI